MVRSSYLETHPGPDKSVVVREVCKPYTKRRCRVDRYLQSLDQRVLVVPDLFSDKVAIRILSEKIVRVQSNVSEDIDNPVARSGTRKTIVHVCARRKSVA
jgi:hypothetical protein